MTAVLLHPDATLNGRFADVGDVGVVLKLYLLLWDIDLDVMTFQQR